MNEINDLITRYPQLAVCGREILNTVKVFCDCYRAGGKVLVCGNGGSAADAEHICAELMKRFKKPRPIDEEVASRLPVEIAQKLEGAVPAISLVSMGGILSAFANDVAWETAFAQQVYALGRKGDILLELSTSGNSENCLEAALVARAKGLKVVVLTGMTGGRLVSLADLAICVPEEETHKIQELHLPIYHAVCAAVEDVLF